MANVSLRGESLRIVATDANGRPVASALAYVYNNNTTVKANVFVDRDGLTAQTNPVVANGAGVFAAIYVPEGSLYTLNVTDTNGDSLPGYPVNDWGASLAEADDLTDAISVVQGYNASALDAKAAAVTAENNAVAAALAAGADFYTTTALMEADTSDGDYGFVKVANGVAIYENVGGVATDTGEVFATSLAAIFLSLSGAAGKYLRINDGETSGEFVEHFTAPTIPAPFSAWGVLPKYSFGIGDGSLSECPEAYARRVHSGLMGGAASWVDPINGSDSNSGNHAAPYQTLDKALSDGTPSVINCLPGVYDKYDFRSTDSAGAKIKILVARGECFIREPADNAASATWTANATYVNVWEMSLTSSNPDICAVLDYNALTQDGKPTSIPRYSTLAEVNSMSRGVGYFHDTVNNLLQIRYNSNKNLNNVKSGLQIVTGDASSRCLIYGTKVVHVGNWRLEGVFFQPLPLSGNVPELYFEALGEGPHIAFASTHGLDSLGAKTYFKDVVAESCAGDNFHYTDNSGEACEAIEWGCTSKRAGDRNQIAAAPNTSNGSSMHGTGSIYRLGGEYSYNWGPAVVDTGTGKSLNIGITTKGGGVFENTFSGNDYGIYCNNTVEMYAYNCSASGHAQADLATADTATLTHRGVTFRTSSGSGLTEVTI